MQLYKRAHKRNKKNFVYSPVASKASCTLQKCNATAVARRFITK